MKLEQKSVKANI